MYILNFTILFYANFRQYKLIVYLKNQHPECVSIPEGEISNQLITSQLLGGSHVLNIQLYSGVSEMDTIISTTDF